MSTDPRTLPGGESSGTQSFDSAAPVRSTLPRGPAAPAVPAALADHPRYRVLELLGAGGMGAVYKAEHQLMERAVALKVINPTLVDSPSMAERFRREVKAAARLAHPNIVAAYDADEVGGTHFLVMEFVEGTSIGRLVADRGPLPVDRACDYVRQAALGLQHAFERGMVHRDIKPQNLMLTPDGRVKVLDFGLARFAAEAAPAGEPAPPAAPDGTAAGGTPPGSLTHTGAAMGTPDYLAPEQARDAHLADIRADVYSLGCTLYHLLAGHAPFAGGTARDKLAAHSEQPPPPLADARPDLPPALVRVVERMMAKDPARRYQTPADVAEALAPFAGPPPSARRGTRRRRAIAAAAALAVLAAVVSLAWTGRPPAPAAAEVVRTGPPAAAPEAVAPPRRPVRGEGVPARYRASIDKGLAYLAAAQRPDGHWEANGGQYPTALTPLVGMALLMDGSTLREGRRAESVRKAADWLMGQAQPSGLLVRPDQPTEASRYLFGHGYAMLFLATVYSQEPDGDRRRKLEQLLTRAVEFTGKAQTTRGGWGYVAAAAGDNFDECACTIVQLQGLRAARNAGIAVPKRLFDMDYLRRCTGPDGGVVYSITRPERGGRPPLTAAALACMLTAGEFDSDLARKWLTYCRRTIPAGGRRIGHDDFTHYYYAQALYILGDTGYEKLFPDPSPAERLPWSKYRDTLFDSLAARQAADGSWNTGYLGRVYSTACYLTALQLDNGALEIYHR